MARDDQRDEALTDAAMQIKKRARRRLIGAAALALFAAIILPMVMDDEPAVTLKDIQVRIPSPDEGVAQRLAPKPPDAVPAAPTVGREVAQPAVAEPAKPGADRQESRTSPSATGKSRQEKEPVRAGELQRGEDALAGRVPAEQWEVQLGAYREPASVANLVRRLQELGLPTYTEKIDTPNGPRTRVRAGPFPTQEAAERARTRVKILGVDGPVARKP